MDKETRDQLIDGSIKALQDASRVLTDNIRQIQDASRDLEKKRELLEEWDSDHLKLNRHLLIDLDDIGVSDLTQQIQDYIQTLHELKDVFFHYINLIEKEFEALAARKRDEIDDLL